jgi:putative transposase
MYYVTLRGNGGQRIFYATEHFSEFNLQVARSLRRYRCRLHAFCWTERRVMMAVQIDDLPVWRFVQHLTSRYAKYLHSKLGRTGHLFDHHHRAVVVQRSRYLLQLVRHIHRAPVRERIVAEPQDYEWSGDRAYRDIERVPWLTTHVVREQLIHADHPGAVSYGDWVSRGDDEVSELFERPNVRAIGDDTFLVALADRRDPGRAEDLLDQIIARTTRAHGVSLASILSRSRRRRHVLVRAVVAWEATQSGAATLKDVAMRFGRDPSTLWSAIERYRVEHPELFPERGWAGSGDANPIDTED